MASSDDTNTPLLTPASASSPDASGTSTPRPAKSDPLGFMDKLSSAIYLYRRPATSSSSPTSASTQAPPKLVLLFSWMDAGAAHIAKYITAYRDGRVFADGSVPETILLVRSNQTYVFDKAKASKMLQPALPVIKEFMQSIGPVDEAQTANGADVRLLVHTFSNGGCIMFSQLFDELASLGQEEGGGSNSSKALGRVLPPHVTVFDSCPGKFHYGASATAFAMPFERKSLALRAVVVPIVHLYVLYFWLKWEAVAWWTGQRELAQVPGQPNEQAMRMYRAWVPPNNHTAAGGNRLEVCRAYIYSPGDRIILAPDVEEHAAEATAGGFTVARLDKFPNSAHVAHQRADPERYWRTVREVWEGR